MVKGMVIKTMKDLNHNAPDVPENPDLYEPSFSKQNKKKIRIVYVLTGLFMAAAIASGVGFSRELYINKQGRSYYADLTADIKIHPRKTGDNKTTSAQLPRFNTQARMGNVYTTGETDAEEAIIDTDPQTEDQWAPYVDFEALRKDLPGLSAWITLSGSVLDYPIMQCTDNYYFLRHLPDGTKHRNGAIFLDYRNNADFSDKNTLIYGHESKTGDMFGILKSYREQSFYEENPVICVYTQEKDYGLILIAGYLVDSGVELPPIEFNNETAFVMYISEIKRFSFFESDVEVSVEDRIVSLCTCAYDFPDARLVIVGKLVELW
jgi:sortase B